jgi:hypothetical protein
MDTLHEEKNYSVEFNFIKVYDKIDWVSLRLRLHASKHFFP